VTWKTYLCCLAGVEDAAGHGGGRALYLRGDVERAEVDDAAGEGRHVCLWLL